MRRHRALAACLLLMGHAGCLRHHLVHPRTLPEGVVTWERTEVTGKVQVHMLGAAPAGSDARPAVLVHPLAGKPAESMRGVLWSLASRGYVAVAADYRRLIDGRFRKSMFAWRGGDDPDGATRLLLHHPRIDRGRVALLGFSQGGVFSLLIASRNDVRAVVAYYPVTDFERWLERERKGPVSRFVWGRIRRYFFLSSGARDEEEFRELLAHASPYRHAGEIRAPVLLVHGEEDRSAPVEESRLLAARLEELGREVELLTLPREPHAFNFKHREPAAHAWRRTLEFLERHLGAPAVDQSTD